VLENQHAKHHFRRRPKTASATALRKAPAHRIEHAVEQRIVVQGFIDATKPRIHLLLRLEIPETQHFPESALPVATAKHPDF
jgi:hypothetical protein